jgi:hypothetical protein
MKALVFSVACLGYCAYRYLDMKEKERKFEIFKKSMELYRQDLAKDNVKISEKIRALDELKTKRIQTTQISASQTSVSDNPSRLQ